MGNTIDIEYRKIKGTPYKVVLSKWQPIGIFDHDKYVEKKNFSEAHEAAIATFHATTLKERVEEMANV